jgi:hypothetical protein
MFRLRNLAFVASLSLVIGIGSSGSVAADEKHHLHAVPFTFVGNAAECGGVAGSRIVTSGWLHGMGLPDDGALNAPAPDAARDPHSGLLLSKNGPQADCSSAGAVIRELKKDTTLTELGFDYRNGGHCGAGAPRFNVTDNTGHTFFFGCAHGTKTPAPQDSQWTRVRFTTATPGAEGFVFGASGTKVKRISIVFDEGTDIASDEDPNGVGLAVLDNIDVNGALITRGGPGPEMAENGSKEDRQDLKHDKKHSHLE